MYYKVDFEQLRPKFEKIKQDIPKAAYIFSDEVYWNKFENSFNEAIHETSNFDENIIISINRKYFKPLYKVKSECDNSIDILVEKFLKHFNSDGKRMNKDTLFYMCPEFKLYYIISENVRLSYEFFKNINNFYLYDLEFSTIRFYLRQNIEAFVNMYNLLIEAMITSNMSCATNYFKLCSLYSKDKKDDILESFKEDLRKSPFYSNEQRFKRVIFAKKGAGKKSFISVRSTFYIATKSITEKFKDELDTMKKERFDDYEGFFWIEDLFTYLIELLDAFYSDESKFVHVNINNDYLFNYNTLDKKEYFDNLNGEIEVLFYLHYTILWWACFLLRLRLDTIAKDLGFNLKPIAEDAYLYSIISDNVSYFEREDGSCNKNKPLNFSVILNDFD